MLLFARRAVMMTGLEDSDVVFWWRSTIAKGRDTMTMTPRCATALAAVTTAIIYALSIAPVAAAAYPGNPMPKLRVRPACSTLSYTATARSGRTAHGSVAGGQAMAKCIARSPVLPNLSVWTPAGPSHRRLTALDPGRRRAIRRPVALPSTTHCRRRGGHRVNAPARPVPDLAAAEAVVVLMTEVSEDTLTAATMADRAVKRCRGVYGHAGRCRWDAGLWLGAA